MILGLTPDRLGDGVPSDTPILALLMEIGDDTAVARLVAVADGTTSLYFSSGGGILGAGEVPAVAAASRRFLEVARGFLSALAPIVDPGLPAAGVTQFVAVARDGLRRAPASALAPLPRRAGRVHGDPRPRRPAEAPARSGSLRRAVE